MSAYSDAVLADAPLAYYRLGEASGATVVDSSGYARHGTYGGTITHVAGLVAGDTDTCVDFNGTSNQADVPGFTEPPGNYYPTAEALIRLDATGKLQKIFGRANEADAKNCFVLQVTAANKLEMKIYIASGSLSAVGATTLAAGVTYHVAGFYDGTDIKVVLNGVVDGVYNAPSGFGANKYGNLVGGLIGAGYNGALYARFDGKIDEVAYYGGPVPVARLLAHATAAGLVAAAPPTPTGVAATGGTHQATLSWSAAATATGYDVRVNGGTPTAVGNVTGYTVTGLAGGTTYTLEVRATNGTGASGWASVTATTLPDPPATPTGLAYTPTPETLAFTWAAAARATGYDVRLDAGTALPVGAELAHTFTGLEDYTAHTLEVRATNTGGVSAWASLDAATVHYPPVTYTAAVRLELGPESDPVDVTGTTRTITARRGLSADTSGVSSALEPGTLVATVYGAGVSPQDNPHARPGRPIRLYARDGEDWVRVWTGTLDRARLDFRPRDDYDAPERVVIFEASDAVVDLAALPATTAIGGTFRQRAAHVLDGTGIPYTVTDAGTDDPTPPVLPTDATTVLGQLVLARDTTHSVMHLDPSGVLQLYADRDRPSTHAGVLFSDDKADAAPGTAFYTHLDPQFDTADLINVLEVTTVGEETPATYVDTDSRTEWGPAPASVTVNEGDPEDHAVRYLAGRTTPALAIKRVQFNVTARTGDAALVEVNDAVRLRHRDLGDSLAQVLDLTHTITATRWTVSLTLRALETLPIRWVDVPAGLTWDAVPAGLTWDDAVDWRP